MLGTQTLLSMRQFIEDAEKEKGSLDAELEVTDLSEAEQKKSVQQDAMKALRMLFEDFEAQIKWQNEVDEGSSSACIHSMACGPRITLTSSVMALAGC